MSLFFGSKYVFTVVNQSGRFSGCSITWLYAFRRWWWSAVSCLSQRLLGTASGPGDFQLLVFFKAVCNSSKLMSSHGWYSISVYFCSSLFILSAKWLYSLLFSKTECQNVSVASFLGGFQLISVIYQGFWRTFFCCLQTSCFDWIVYFSLHIS